jgi:hypothetical protein
MQYDITFNYAGWSRYAYHRATADWLMRRFGPTATAALERAGHIPTIYPSPVDTRDLAKGIRQAPEGPRYSTGYGDLIGVRTVLVENHMLKPYRRPIAPAVLRRCSRAGSPRRRRSARSSGSRESASRPFVPGQRTDGQRWTGKPITFRMPIIGQDPIETVTLPIAWWVPPEQTEVLDRLCHAVARRA